MDEKEIIYYQAQFKSLSEAALIESLSQGKGSYEEGVFELIQREVQDRKILVDRVIQQTEVLTSAKKRDSINRLVLWGYIFSTALLGIPGLVMGIKLLKISRAQRSIQNAKALVNGIIITIIGGAIGLSVIIGMILFAIFLFRHKMMFLR